MNELMRQGAEAMRAAVLAYIDQEIAGHLTLALEIPEAREASELAVDHLGTLRAGIVALNLNAVASDGPIDYWFAEHDMLQIAEIEPVAWLYEHPDYEACVYLFPDAPLIQSGWKITPLSRRTE